MKVYTTSISLSRIIVLNHLATGHHESNAPNAINQHLPFFENGNRDEK